MTVNPDVLKENDEVVFHCKVDANPRPKRYRWFMQGDANALHDYDTTGEFLVIERIDRRFNAATIWCEAENDVGMSKSNLLLHVKCKYAAFDSFRFV